jgi:hypothetical protein
VRLEGVPCAKETTKETPQERHITIKGTYMVMAPWSPRFPISVGMGPESFTPVKSLRRPTPPASIPSLDKLHFAWIPIAGRGAGRARGGGGGRTSCSAWSAVQSQTEWAPQQQRQRQRTSWRSPTDHCVARATCTPMVSPPPLVKQNHGR